MTDTKEKSLEDKAKEHARQCGIIARFFGSCDQRTFDVVKRGSESSHKEGYKQALKDMMEKMQNIRKERGWLKDEHWWSLEELQKIAEDLQK